MNLTPRQWSALFTSIVITLLLCASFTSPAQAQCGQFTDSVRALPYPGQEYDSLYKCGDSPYTVVNQSSPGGVTVTFNGGILLATTSGPGYYTTNLLPCNPGFGPQLTISFSQPVSNVWVETNRYGFYYYPSTGQTSITIPAPIDANGKWNFGLFNIYFDATNSSSAPKAGTLVANPASGVPGSTVQVTGAGWVNVLNGEYRLLFDGAPALLNNAPVTQPVNCFTQPNMFFEVPAAAVGAHTITCQLVDTTTQQVVISNQINFNVPCTPQAGTIATDVTSGLPGATVNLTGTGWQTGTGNIYQVALDGSSISGAVQSPASCADQPQIIFDIPCQTPPGTHQLTCRLVNSSTQQVVAESPSINFIVTQPTSIGPLATACQTITISQDNDLWYFCGEKPKDFALEVTLTANGSGITSNTKGTFLWEITTGDTIVNFSHAKGNKITTNGNTVDLESAAASQNRDDVTIRVTFNGVTSADYKLSVRAPKLLKPSTVFIIDEGVQYDCQTPGNLGFRSSIQYDIINNLGEIVENAGINETFGTRTDEAQNNWQMANPRQYKYLAPDGEFADIICQAGNTKLMPLPLQPQDPRTNNRIFHAIQNWFSGSTNSGKGCLIQINDLVEFQDHGRHENIKSPVPQSSQPVTLH